MKHALFPPYLNEGSRDVGDFGPVKILQDWLQVNEFGAKELVSDGHYGHYTAKSVKRLQRALGFRGRAEVDGNFGPKTRAEVKKKFDQDFDATHSDHSRDKYDDCGVLYRKPGHSSLFPWPEKERRKKDSIHGRRIPRKQALRGLGDPKKWPAKNKKTRNEFSEKPGSRSPGIRHFPKGSLDEIMNRVIGPKPGQPVGGGKPGKQPKLYQVIRKLKRKK